MYGRRTLNASSVPSSPPNRRLPRFFSSAPSVFLRLRNRPEISYGAMSMSERREGSLTALPSSRSRSGQAAAAAEHSGTNRRQ
jgi:hypothetical protein